MSLRSFVFANVWCLLTMSLLMIPLLFGRFLVRLRLVPFPPFDWFTRAISKAASLSEVSESFDAVEAASEQFGWSCPIHR